MGVQDGRSVWSDGENAEQRDMVGKKVLLEFKARVIDFNTSAMWGLKNSGRAYEIAEHVHSGSPISQSTKQEYVQKLVKYLLEPAQLDASGKGPMLVEYALEGPNGAKAALQASRKAHYTQEYTKAKDDADAGDIRKSIPAVGCLMNFAKAEVEKICCQQPTKYCTVSFTQCPMEAGEFLVSFFSISLHYLTYSCHSHELT